jgi:cytochrome c biogenesis protein CcmG, thiol:disulfide interchange protein DsbE
MKRLWLWLPLALVITIFTVFAAGLIKPADRSIASGMVGKPLPAFVLAGPFAGDPVLDTNAIADGKPRLVNIFASWCIPCVAEAPVLLQLQQQGVDIIGVAIRERPETLEKFLNENGNPYSRIGYDPTSRIQLLFGSTGVPETFVVDGKGKITHQHIGVIAPEDVSSLLAKLKDAG